MSNIKKPGFFVIAVAIIIVTAVVVGLMAKPKANGLDELEEIKSLAWEVINRDIANYELNPEVNIIDSKITRLELVETFDELADTPIDVYALEYRLLPENLSKVVLAGGMDVDENGWLKETCSMGSPLLVVSRNNDPAELVGIIWTGEITDKAELESEIKSLLTG